MASRIQAILDYIKDGLIYKYLCSFLIPINLELVCNIACVDVSAPPKAFSVHPLWVVDGVRPLALLERDGP